jgi:hypothetical protein
MRTLAATVIALALFSGATLAEDSTPARAATGAPDATVEISGRAIAAGIGFEWGHGEVTFHGQKHRFNLSGLSIVDVGVADISASGVVYNLRNLQDLNGNYAVASAGLTIAGGGSAAYLENEHGVVIKIVSTSRGLRFNLSATGMKLRLQDTEVAGLHSWETLHKPGAAGSDTSSLVR